MTHTGRPLHAYLASVGRELCADEVALIVDELEKQVLTLPTPRRPDAGRMLQDLTMWRVIRAAQAERETRRVGEMAEKMIAKCLSDW